MSSAPHLADINLRRLPPLRPLEPLAPRRRPSGSPMSYLADGKQYIIVAVSGGNYSGEYLAFALPGSGARTSSAGGR